MYIVEYTYGYDYEGSDSHICGIFTNLIEAKEAIKEWISHNWDGHSELPISTNKEDNDDVVVCIAYYTRNHISYEVDSIGIRGDSASIVIYKVNKKNQLSLR